MSLAPASIRTATSFSDVQVDLSRDGGDFALEYDRIVRRFDEAVCVSDWLEAVRDWDDLRRRLQTWQALVELRFRQNTKDPTFRADSDALNAVRPKIDALDAAIKRRLLESPFREELAAELGSYTFARWACQIAAIDPRNDEDACAEATLGDEYTALLAGARIPFEYDTHNLSDIAKFAEDASRSRREGSMRAKWAFYTTRRNEIDSIFDRLVTTRTRMARTMGYENFVELGYRRMTRTDYGPTEVAAYRAAIERDIVPLCTRIARRQAEHLGIDRVRIWDERVFDSDGAPLPPNTYAGIIGAARAAFANMGSEFGTFANTMIDGGLLDLQSRDGKSGGGFCTSFPSFGLPYIFASFNASTHDVNVLLHEMGHAFQCYSSRSKPLLDQLWPTLDACEVHSMSMEFLAWPQLERFFGAQAARYRHDHLAAFVLALPYSALVDHFQHVVYERPGASPRERHAFWKELEERYLPWRDNGDIEHLETGALWHAQRHIFVNPFYYIDYALAMSCALQFWAASQDNYSEALNRYLTLCRRGGDAPFVELIRSAGLESPFDVGIPAGVLARVERTLLTD
jgi:M3 family oligoendopeptidase